MKRSKKPDTILTHAGNAPGANHGIINPPVYHASTIVHADLESLRGGENRALQPAPDVYDYGRIGTPTSTAFETAVAELEGAYGTISVPSGLNAVTTALMAFVEQGDHILITDSTYGPTRRFCSAVLSRLGIETEFYDPCIEDISALFRPNTRLLYTESPGSQTFEMQDLPALASAAEKAGIVTMTDNTWASPLYCQPLALGIDVSIQAATKYIVGHSDVMMGTISLGDKAHFEKVKRTAILFGTSAGPDDHYLALRGLRTMSVRLARHQENALKIAQWLQGRPEVSRVLYPALPDDPGHALWKRDCSGASGLLAVVLRPAPDDAFRVLIEGLDLFPIGASWGGYESLSLPAKPMRTATKWDEPGDILRLHIGLEDVEDLTADLAAGLDRFSAAAGPV
ncbi:MAG: cystathionine beta-lyase [Pseudomonadota bacterium]